MKKFLLSTVALLALGTTVPALAADLGTRTPYTKAPAYIAPVYNWTGFYLGGNIGGAFGLNNSFGGTTSTGNNSAFMGGLQVGGNYQFATNWVIGLEGQYDWLANSNNAVTFPGTGFVYSSNQRGLGSVTGRLGYTWGPGLIYAKGGYAYSDSNQSLSFGGAPAAFTQNGSRHDGYTVGAGFEYMFAPNWSAVIEYQYYNFGKTNFTTPAALTTFGNVRNEDQTVKAGINYHFNWGGPVVAKY